MTGAHHPPDESTLEHALDRMIEADHGVHLTALSPGQWRLVSWLIDLLISVVILNLFAEFAPDHIGIDSFWITLLVAVLFRLLLTAMDKVKYWLQGHLRARNWNVLAAVGVLPVFFVGKLIILEVVDGIFVQVDLDGFWYEWFLIFFLIVAPLFVWSIFDRLGTEPN